MPNFSSLARLEVPEKFLWVGWVGWGGWGLQSHFRVKPNRCVVLCWGWGFDKILSLNACIFLSLMSLFLKSLSIMCCSSQKFESTHPALNILETF